MMLFKTFRQRFADAGTIRALCEGAEKQARADHQQAPGAEHFLLAALELPDQSARRALARLGIDAEGFRDALVDQHQAALERIGVGTAEIEALEGEPIPLPAARGLYNAAPSGQAVIQDLAALRKHGHKGPLLAAHVVAVIAAKEHGVVARAIKMMGISLDDLAAAAAAELAAADEAD